MELNLALNQMAQALQSLTWIDKAFGKAERLTDIVNGKRYSTPNVYIGKEAKSGNEYLSMLPDSRIGNFAFFVVDDPQELEWQSYQQMRMTIPVSLIVWFDLRKVYGEYRNRDTEALKTQVLHLLNGRSTGFHLDGARVQVTKIWERAENIYKGFTIDEVDNQFLMHPYSGFRFDCTLTLDTPCL